MTRSEAIRKICRSMASLIKNFPDYGEKQKCREFVFALENSKPANLSKFLTKLLKENGSAENLVKKVLEDAGIDIKVTESTDGKKVVKLVKLMITVSVCEKGLEKIEKMAKEKKEEEKTEVEGKRRRR
jgi:hypothetical protein